MCLSSESKQFLLPLSLSDLTVKNKENKNKLIVGMEASKVVDDGEQQPIRRKLATFNCSRCGRRGHSAEKCWSGKPKEKKSEKALKAAAMHVRPVKEDLKDEE